jgi:hypothetical protein
MTHQISYNTGWKKHSNGKANVTATFTNGTWMIAVENRDMNNRSVAVDMEVWTEEANNRIEAQQKAVTMLKDFCAEENEVANLTAQA